MVQYILIAYFIPNSLYLLLPSPYIAPPPLLRSFWTLDSQQMFMDLTGFSCVLHCSPALPPICSLSLSFFPSWALGTLVEVGDCWRRKYDPYLPRTVCPLTIRFSLGLLGTLRNEQEDQDNPGCLFKMQTLGSHPSLCIYWLMHFSVWELPELGSFTH